MSIFLRTVLFLLISGFLGLFFGPGLALLTAGEIAKPETILLWPDSAPIGDGSTEKSDASISIFRPEKPNGTVILICPGGGYGGLVSGPEGNGIAAWLNQNGVTGVVLKYRLPKGRSAVPLLDARQALRLLRQNNTLWNLQMIHLGIMGFSAGGHLASTAGTHFDDTATGNSRPDFMVLIYPVISMGDLTHKGSRFNLLGATPDKAQIDLFSNEKQVTNRTPPAFLAHAKDDQVVLPENSNVFYEALLKHGVASQYLELADGGHGLNGYHGPSWDSWQTASLQWMKEQGFLPKTP